MKIKPTETLYFFVKEQRKLMTPNKCIAEYAREARPEEEEAGKEKVLNIIVRKTDTF